MAVSSPVRDTEEHSDQAAPSVALHVSPFLVAMVLSLIALLLAFAHLLFSLNYHYVERVFPAETILFVLFDLTGEVTIPTWYSASLLLAAALLLAAIARLRQRLGRSQVSHWYGLAVLFIALSIDEAADIHGAVSYKLQNVFGFGGALAYPWVIPAAMLVVVVAVAYLPFVRRLPADTRQRFVLAAILYVGGALGMEVIEAAYDSSFDHYAPYLVMVAVEEVLEMVGVIVLISALLSYLISLSSGLRFSLRASTMT